MIGARTGYNNLRVYVYSSGTTRIPDTGGELYRIQDISLATFYPGGLFGTASFFMPRDVTLSLPFSAGDRVEIRNGQAVCYEGQITRTGYDIQRDAQGVRVNCDGYWGQILGKRLINKRWADQRTDNSVWRWKPDSLGAANNQFKAESGPDNRLKIIPKGVAWTNGDYVYIEYVMPTGETVKRVTCTSELQEGAQAWEIDMVDGAGNVLFSRTSSGSGSHDATLGTPNQTIRIRFFARANQTPTEDGTYWGEVRDLVVYSETGSITPTEIVKDIRAAYSDINSDETNIGSNSLSLVPFMTDGSQYASTVLANVLKYGDGSFNQWAAGFLESERAASPDGEPVMYFEQYAALTDYDYAVRIGGPNLQAPLQPVLDTDGVYNYIVVKYRDPLFDNDLYRDFEITPADDANLTDSTSSGLYGPRHLPVDAGQATSTTATNLGRRYLAARKDPHFYVNGPVTVKGYIRTKSGELIPSSQIRAGKRLRIENWLSDIAGVSGGGFTARIVGTAYRDSDETCALTLDGPPDSLAVFLAQRERGIIR